MKFSQIQGNDSLRTAFEGMASSGKIPHAVMLHEDDGGGAYPIAAALLQYLFCHNASGHDSCGECPSCNKISKNIHPDVHFVFPVMTGTSCASLSSKFRELLSANHSFTESELNRTLGIEGKSSIIGVGESRALLETLSVSALEGGYRAVVMYLPEKMNQEAANRLLKIVEEPPLKTQFIFITHSPEKVLQTISSRCQHFRVMPGTASAVIKDSFDEFGKLMDALLAHDLGAALEIGDELASLPSRENAKSFCKFAASVFRDIFLIQQGLPLEGSGLWSEVGECASKCRRTFPRAASEVMSRSVSLIDRNVNLKILFTDMVNRLYMII